MRRFASALTLTAVAALAACAGNPAPGQEGYPYNVDGKYDVEFAADDGGTYTGTMRLATAPGGSVEGEMVLDDPMSISGSVEGTLIEDRLGLSVAFEIPETGCRGVAAGSGTVAEGGAPVEGTVVITADCEAPPEASFRLAR